jgi:hypothetical protein
MNPWHAVDIYVDATTLEAAVHRRRDGHWWRSRGPADPDLLGRAVAEALHPGPVPELTWESGSDGSAAVTVEREVVVVWRQGHGTVVASPVCDWGKAPDVLLDVTPRHRALGEAVLAQARFSAVRSGR